MPSPTTYLGGYFTAYVPNVDDLIGLGYTVVRFYSASSENGSYTLAGTQTLVSGTYDYSYNQTDALITDWFYWAPYGATPGEGPASEPMPVGPPRVTRKQVRQGVGDRLNLLEVVTATGTSATVFTAPELIDPDRSVYEIGSRWARPSSGAYAGNTRRVRAGAAGYSDTATGQVTVGRSFGGTLAASTEVELWQARGSIDPSAKVDDAMQTARLNLWWEETFYLTTDSGVTDYYLPASVLKESVRRVEFAAGTYPNQPDWRPVGWWDIVKDGGMPLLTVLASAQGMAPYSAGTIIRLVYNRMGDRMDDDTDYWNVALEWAVAETAYDYLNGQLTPSGGREDLGDVAAAAQRLLAECFEMRSLWMPEPAPVQTRLPR